MLAEFLREIELLRWADDTIVEQSQLIHKFGVHKATLPLAEVTRIERNFLRVLSISRDKWFQLLVATQPEKAKLLKKHWETNKNIRPGLTKPSTLGPPPLGPSIPTLPPDIYPTNGWIGEYMQDYCSVMESPDSYLFWSGAAILSAVSRRNVWTFFGPSKLFTNIYCILVSDSATARKGAPVKAAEKFASTISDVNILDRTTTERLPHDISTQVISVNGQPQSVPRDAQAFICAEELVNFLGNEHYNSGILSFLIEWWDSQDRKATRTIKHGIVELRNLHITLIGGTTPSWLEGQLHNVVAGGGMLSRTVWVCEDRTPKEIPWPIPPSESTFRHLSEWLRRISQRQGEFVVTPAAMQYNAQWYTIFRKYLQDNRDEAPAMERRQAYMIKLAMILALSEDLPLDITPNLLMRADRILSATDKGLPELAHSLLATPMGKDHVRILNQLRKNGGTMVHTDLLRLNSPYGMDSQTFKKIVGTLEESGQLKSEIEVGKRRRTVYRLIGKPSQGGP